MMMLRGGGGGVNFILFSNDAGYVTHKNFCSQSVLDNLNWKKIGLITFELELKIDLGL